MFSMYHALAGVERVLLALLIASLIALALAGVAAIRR